MLIFHIGAGCHDIRKTQAYKKLISKALKSEGSYLEVSRIIEKSPLTNTGHGSSLNLLGEVECDASIIEFSKLDNKFLVTKRSLLSIDDSYFPILKTQEVFDQCMKTYGELNQLGITLPLKLNYQSLKRYFPTPATEVVNLVSKSARLFYDTYRSKVNEKLETKLQVISESITSSVEHSASQVEPNEDFAHKEAPFNGVSDTIGLIKIEELKTSIATSSGGNFFKIPGRISCAGEIGSSIDFKYNSNYEISCMCSGNGEDIIQMNLARYIVDNFNTDDLAWGESLTNLIKNYSKQFRLFARNNDNEPILYIGVILCIHDTQSGKVGIIYCHSTESFYFGFKSGSGESNTVLSRLDNPLKAGEVFAYGEFNVKH